MCGAPQSPAPPHQTACLIPPIPESRSEAKSAEGKSKKVARGEARAASATPGKPHANPESKAIAFATHRAHQQRPLATPMRCDAAQHFDVPWITRPSVSKVVRNLPPLRIKPRSSYPDPAPPEVASPSPPAPVKALSLPSQAQESPALRLPHFTKKSHEQRMITLQHQVQVAHSLRIRFQLIQKVAVAFGRS